MLAFLEILPFLEILAKSFIVRPGIPINHLTHGRRNWTKNQPRINLSVHDRFWVEILSLSEELDKEVVRTKMSVIYIRSHAIMIILVFIASEYTCTFSSYF